MKKEDIKREDCIFGCRVTSTEKALIASAVNKHSAKTRRTYTDFLLDAADAKLDSKW